MGAPLMGGFGLAVSVLIGLFPAVSSTPSSSVLAAVSTACDALPDTPVPTDAVIGGFGPSQFLADVDGDGHKDVVTGYWTGNADPDLADHYLHVELASGWGTAILIDDLAQFSNFPMATPGRVVDMAGQRSDRGRCRATCRRRQLRLLLLPRLCPRPGSVGVRWLSSAPVGSVVSPIRFGSTADSDGMVALDLFRGLDDQGELIPDVLVGGEALSYRLNPNTFGPPTAVELGLPRTDVDLHGEYPNCESFVGSFVDDDDSVFHTAIEWLALEGITNGCNPPVNDRFCPERSVSERGDGCVPGPGDGLCR